MNWGYKILFVYIAFVAGTLFLVFRASGEKDDLVTADYYWQELKYQQRIDETTRTNALSAAVQYELHGNTLMINFPKDFAGKTINGEIQLYCPTDEQKDIKQSFTAKDDITSLEIPNGHKGTFELHLNWEVNGVNYYYEGKIIL